MGTCQSVGGLLGTVGLVWFGPFRRVELDWIELDWIEIESGWL